ncbi:XopAK family type III secretion system effector [Trinickia caryophylli]|uniref:XopAK family type III secretion system effector n=1 Tax=Trinickia caryophylli TaxID=28094 RepID=UPI0018EAF0C6
MERTYADLFATTHIRKVSSRSGVPATTIQDVDMDECVVINAARDGYDALGTTGVATCIAICAQGKNARGEPILGLCHYSGIQDAEEVLDCVKDMMAESGVARPEIFLVGGMISNAEDEGSFEMERDLLALRDRFDIKGAKLHVSMSDSDGEPNSVNVVMTGNGVYFSEASLYR